MLCRIVKMNPLEVDQAEEKTIKGDLQKIRFNLVLCLLVVGILANQSVHV